MDEWITKPKRRKTPWVVGTLMVASLALLIILQSTNLWKTFTIESSSDLLLLYALSSLNFVAFIIFAFIFLRSIVKLVRERRTFQLGAQIKTRLLIYFCALSLLPIIAMAVFSYLFMNRALERWFSQIPQQVMQQARNMQQISIDDRKARVKASARMLAATLDGSPVTEGVLKRIAEAGDLVYVAVKLDQNSPTIAAIGNVRPEQHGAFEKFLLAANATRVDIDELGASTDFDIGIDATSDGKRLIIASDPVSSTSVEQLADSSLSELNRLGQEQFTIRRIGLLTLGVLTFLLLFASSWIAFYVARGLTAPIKALAEGASEIAKGNFGHRVEVLAEDELAILVDAFNDMSARLDANSTELTERRRYIETVLDTLATGVISFDAEDRVNTINNAAAGILGLDATESREMSVGSISTEGRDVIMRLLSRARRVGQASDQTVLRGLGSDDGERTVAITASALPEESGVVLVIEDLSELIAAQRASAWQEVARRMAHEIKNPLTPIQLSAERIAKRFERSRHNQNGIGNRIDDGEPLGGVVHESTETILREVRSLKAMVDEFSRFARLPKVELRPGDIANVIRQSVAAFEGRFPMVDIDFVENGELPEIMQDSEQLKRVFVNLIDNAVEAFDADRKEKKVVLTARHDEARGIVVAEVSDNGKGISPSDLQKLFQPYFSTKGRGTGLGLAIVKRIISEHNGRINVVGNHPHGAKFIIELPVNA